jgi:iron complex transport system ATP-binding protein
MTEAAIACRGAGHSYDGQNWLFRELSFDVWAGDIFAILGPNGRGKTTLLRALVGLIRPTCGEIMRNGAMGYVPQSFAPSFPYSVLDVVLMGRARHVPLMRSPSSRDFAIARDALGELGLSKFADRSVDALSGGEKQLVLLARALASESPLLILDEPASALDFKNQETVLAFIQRLTRERGLTVLFTTHQPQHVFAVANRALIMLGGDHYLAGDIDSVMTEENLSALYGIALRKVSVQTDEGEVRSIIPAFRLRR